MERILEAALRWLSENPIVPTPPPISGDYLAIREDYKMSRTSFSWESYYAVEWQRRMFLAPETEVPEEIKDLVWDNRGYAQDHVMKKHKEEILEAYHRGLAAAVTKK